MRQLEVQVSGPTIDTLLEYCERHSNWGRWGPDDELGTLQPGLRADLLVLDANPLEDIRATRQIDSVWIAGRRLEDLP